MYDPDAEKLLTRMERLTLGLGRLINETRVGRAIQWLNTRWIGYRWTRFAIEKRTFVSGHEKLAALPGDRSVLLVANHRSYFDFFVAMDVALAHGAIWRHKLCFPVRAPFFYDTLTGLAINMLAAGGSMYPPIFRDERGATLNRFAVENVVHLLSTLPRVAVGFHPEGGRNRNPDPYAMGPARKGAGEIALRTDVIVVPLFINGIDNDFRRTISQRFDRGSRIDDPVLVMVGDPVDMRERGARPPTPENCQALVDEFRQSIVDLMPNERALRKACAADAIGADDPGWLINARCRRRR